MRLQEHIQLVRQSFFDPLKFPLEVSSEGFVSADTITKPAGFCDSCATSYVTYLQADRNDFWQTLPAIFKLEDWKKLRETTKY